MKPKVEFFKSANKKWRWRLVASNGRKLCTPGEDFSSRRAARENCARVMVAFRKDIRYYEL